MSRQIRFNAFEMNCVAHQSPGLWRHPRDRSRDYKTLGYWTELAQILERGLFDGLFLADVLGVYDVFGAGPDSALRHATQVPVNDPLLLVPAMAAVTRHLGFGVTVNLSYEPPFTFARRMSTLDHLTEGRIGWNVVTGYLDSAARAMGLAGQKAHDDRYAGAEDYIETVYKLWEGSWADDAVIADAPSGIFTLPAKVRRIRHGDLEALHLSEPSPQRTPLIYQAGTSSAGRAFAARHAECVFLNPSSPENVARIVADLRAKAAPRPLRIFVGATLILGRTEAEAQDLLADYRNHASLTGALAHAAASLGIDFDRFGMDEPIAASGSNAISSNVEAMARVFGPGWTKRHLIDQFILGSRQKPLVGTPDAIADQLIAFAEATGVDGFNLSRTVMPECIEAVADLLVPALQARGAYKTAYAPGTYREKLFGAGSLLAAPHPAAALRG